MIKCIGEIDKLIRLINAAHIAQQYLKKVMLTIVLLDLLSRLILWLKRNMV